jgi:hypothetical protein
MLTGAVPEESMQRALEDNLVPPSDLGADLPPKAEWALMAALVVKPEQRTRDIATLKAGLSNRSFQVVREPAPVTATARAAPAVVPVVAPIAAAHQTTTDLETEKKTLPIDLMVWAVLMVVIVIGIATLLITSTVSI